MDDMTDTTLSLATPPKHVFWPSIITSPQDAEKLARVSSGKTWIEINLSNKSLAPFAPSHHLWLIYDRRPWVYNIVTRSHSAGVRSTFLSLKDAHQKQPFDAMMLREMARNCSKLEDDNDVGVAVFLLWATGGITTNAATIEKSLTCTNVMENPPLVMERHALTLCFICDPMAKDDEIIKAAFKDMTETKMTGYHINVNWTSMCPTAERVKLIADSLMKRGISWSFMLPDKIIAKDVAEAYRVVKIDSAFYASGAP